MATIDTLDIQITSNAGSAIRAIDGLSASASRLQMAATGAAGGAKDLASGAKESAVETREAGKQSGSAEKSVKRFGKSAKDAGDSAKKGSSGIASFWGALKRIAFYRFVRSIIREIGDAFKTGITNLYQWSSAVNGTFAKSMDRIATSTLYLKNSLGAMLAPLINTLAPVIEWIIDRIVEVINWINKLFAALSGSQTYTVAKKVATKWGEAGQSAASSAKKAADDIKRTILGFDEINKLEKENTSSGGGGGGSSSPGTDYTNMFETRQLDGWMSKLAKFISDFNLQIPATFGAILAGFEAVKLAISAVAKLGLGWLKDMAGKTIEVAVSLVRKGWSTIKNWALSFGQAVVDLAVKIKTSVAELWTKFAAAWSALSPVLKVGIAISITAAALWAAYKLAWALVPDKMLALEAKISTTAAQLKNGLVNAWNSLTEWSLTVKLRLITMANDLKNSIVQAWGNLMTWYLGVRLQLITTAAQLKNDIVSAWAKLTAWALNVKLRIETTAAKLKGDLVKSWAALGAWTLGVKVAITTKASELWESVQKGWNSITGKVVSFGAKISTAMSTLWQWVKDNWATVAVTALGIAVAIATPWAAVAEALGGLWADVMASFGGALTFGVVPKIGRYSNGGIGNTNSRQEFLDQQDEISQFVEDFKNGVERADPTINVSVSAQVGMGMRRRSDSSYGMEPDVSNSNATVNVDMWTPWWYFHRSPIEWLQMDNLSTTVKVYATVANVSNAVNAVARAVGGRARGGIFSGGAWSDIPQYAGGTTNAHGSLFLAGEAGPEIVGHVGGRTEVLNKSQIASAMFSAVRSAMSGVSLDANFRGGSMGGSSEFADYASKEHEDMRTQNELLRQQNELLRMLYDKDNEWSTTGLSKAQAYVNRRAGATIIPVGT